MKMYFVIYNMDVIETLSRRSTVIGWRRTKWKTMYQQLRSWRKRWERALADELNVAVSTRYAYNSKRIEWNAERFLLCFSLFAFHTCWPTTNKTEARLFSIQDAVETADSDPESFKREFFLRETRVVKVFVFHVWPTDKEPHHCAKDF